MSSLITSLSESEKKIYHSLVAFGQLSLGEICQYNSFPIEQGEEIIKSLKDKKLIAEIIGLSNRYIPKYPFFETSKELTDSLARVKDIRTSLEDYFDKKNSEIKDLQAAKQQEVEDQIQPSITSLSSKNDTLKGDLNQSIIEFNETTTGYQTNTINQLKSDHENINQINANFMANIQSSVLVEIKNTINDLQSALETVKSDLTAFENSFGTETTNWVESTHQNMDTASLSLKNAFQELTGNINKSLLQNKEAISTLSSSNAKIENESDAKLSLLDPIKVYKDLSASIQVELGQSKDNFESILNQFIQQGTGEAQEIGKKLIEQINETFDQFKNSRTTFDQELNETVKTAIVESQEDFKTRLNENIEKISGVENQQINSVSELNQSIKTNYEQGNNEIQSMLGELDQELMPNFENQTALWKDKINASINDMSSSIQNQFLSLDSSLNGFTGQLDEQFDKITQMINASVNEAKSNQSTYITQELESIKLQLAGELEKAHMFVNQGIETLAKYKEDLNTQSIPATKMTIAEFQKIRDNQRLDFKLGISDFVKNLKTSLSSQLDDFTGNIDKFMSEYTIKEQTKYDTWAGDLNSQLDGVSNAVQHFASLEEPKNLVTSLSQSVSSVQSNLASKSQDVVTAVLSQVEGTLNNLSKEHQQTINQHLMDLKSTITELKNKSETDITDITNQITPDLTELKNQFTNQITNFKNLLENHQQKILVNIPSQTNESLTSLVDIVKTYGSATKQDLLSFQENISSTLEKISAKWIDNEKIISEKQSEQISVLQSQFQSHTDSWSKENNLATESLSNTVKSEAEKLNEIMTTFVQKLTSSLQESFTTMISEQQDQFSSLNDSNETAFQSQQEIRQQTYENSKKSLEKLVNVIQSTALGKLENNKNSITNTQEKVEKSFNENHLATADEFTAQIQTAFDSAENMLTNFVEQLNTNQNTVTQQNIEIISNGVNSFIDLQQGVKEQIKQGASDQFELVLKGAEEYANEIADISSSAETILNPRLATLEDLDNIVKNYKFPKVTSAPIIGWAAALTSINQMFESIKSSMTLLIPDPSHIPVEKILATKRTRRITITSQFNLQNDDEKKILKQFFEKGNVTIRRLEKGSYGGQATDYPPYLAADRDGELVLFGSQDKENESVFIGMISENRNFIDLMGKVVLSDFLSKAKKVDINDL